MRLSTQAGWTMICPSGCNPRTLRNFPIQSTAAEILHVMTVLAERRGSEIVAPIHDAIVSETGAANARELAQATDRLMRDASAVVLKGYELPSDCAILMPGEHFQDKRGKAMWDTITRLLAKLTRDVG
jgi:DNA polymerase I